MPLFYMSFASETAFLGAVIVEAADCRGAIAESWRREINPGGSIQIVRGREQLVVGREWMNRLLSREDLKQLDADLAPTLH